HVAGVLELARVHAEVAVGRLQQSLEIVERQRLDGGQRADHSQPQAVMQERVEAARDVRAGLALQPAQRGRRGRRPLRPSPARCRTRTRRHGAPGARPNLRSGPESSGRRAVRVLASVASTPTTSASPASTIHTRSHAGPGAAPARTPAPSALSPMATSPAPERVVKAAAPSIVWRMKRRSARARSCSVGGVRSGGADGVAVACGLMLPDDELPGVDYVIPDFSYALAKREGFRGVVLTHGHEDHIGALPYLLKSARVPVYATPLTRALVAEKLREHP